MNYESAGYFHEKANILSYLIIHVGFLPLLIKFLIWFSSVGRVELDEDPVE
jgi:hypothetical protein